jgi:type II secretory pathway pseudopilin PulG
MRRNSERGISVIEATIVLAAAAMLTAAAAPSASRVLDRARVTRAVTDAEAIKAAIVAYREDMPGYQGFEVDGTNPTAIASDIIEMLVSDGDIPAIGAGGDARWDDIVRNAPASGLITDFLERHLVTNNPFGNAAMAYPLGPGNTWRGAYLRAPLDADPWGSRYAVNVKYLKAPANTRNDTVVLSAGPDREVNTLFERNGMFPGGDDIIIIVLRDRNSDVP